jgi:hypothetical protein
MAVIMMLLLAGCYGQCPPDLADYKGNAGEMVCIDGDTWVSKETHDEIVDYALRSWIAAIASQGMVCAKPPHNAMRGISVIYQDTEIGDGVGGRYSYGPGAETIRLLSTNWRLSTAHEVGHRFLDYCGWRHDEDALEWWHENEGTPM